MKKEKIKNYGRKLVADKNNFMWAFRQNISMLMNEQGLIMRELSDLADIPYATLNTLIYGSAKDCNISTAVKLARAFSVSIDELVGAETVKPEARDCMSLYRHLPPCDQYLVRWFVNYLDSLDRENANIQKEVSIMELECNEYGDIKITSQYHKADISSIPTGIKPKIFFGITMPCEHYMPVYSPYETLLIANDREPINNENSLIRIDKRIYIAKKRIENGEIKYCSIRDGKFSFNADEITEIIGYIAATIVEKKH